MSRVLFVVDNPKSAGLGHVMRCCELAATLIEQGHECIWWSDGGDIKHSWVARERNFTIEQVSSQLSVSSELLLEYISITSLDAIVIDSYQLGSDTLARLFQYAETNAIAMVGMDDSHFSEVPYFHLLINAAASKTSNSELSHKPIQLIGPKFTIVRSEIIKAQQQQALNVDASHASCKKLLITFGASDVLGLTLPVVTALSRQDILPKHNIKLQVVIGPQVSDLQNIIQYCLSHHIEYWVAPNHYPELVANADFAITAAGGSLFEFAFCGVPSVIVTVAENQLGAARMHSQTGWCDWVDATFAGHRDLALISDNIVNQFKHLMISADKNTERKSIAMGLIDGQGASRVVEELLNYAWK